jgi:hypothetical protein
MLKFNLVALRQKKNNLRPIIFKKSLLPLCFECITYPYGKGFPVVSFTIDFFICQNNYSENIHKSSTSGGFIHIFVTFP